jgi:trigger factor
VREVLRRPTVKKQRGGMMKKKILLWATSALFAMSLTACSSKQLSNEYITVQQYKGLEVPKVEQVEVTDANVESTIESILASSATTEVITDRVAVIGDTVNIDYVGSIDGVEFDGGSATGQSLLLGSGTYIGATEEYLGFEDQIVGHKTGEEFDITVQFPESYSSNEELQNQVAVFRITLNEISVSSTPELTDDWVAENSETSTTVEEYKEEIKKHLEANNQETVDSELQSSVMQILLDKIEVKEYPEDQVQEQCDSLTEYYASMASAYGMEYVDFLETVMGMTEEEFDSQVEQAAQVAVKRKLACELIAKKEKLEPSEEEYEELIAEYAEGSGYTDIDTFKELVGEDLLKSSILQQKVAEYLASVCVQVEE